MRASGDWTGKHSVSMSRKLLMKFSCEGALKNKLLASEQRRLSMQTELNGNKCCHPESAVASLPVTSDVRLYIDGPFCSPTEDVWSYPVSVCVAGGIGVTPFISVLTFIG